MIGSPTTLRGRLLTIALIATVAALACALLANVLANAWSFHRQTVADLRTQADLLGRMTSPALMFNDATLARDNLALFESRPRIRAAAIYDESGELFASYRAAKNPGTIPDAVGTTGARLVSGRIQVFKPIQAHGTSLGSVYLQAESGLAAAFARGAVAALVAGLMALAVAWLLVRRLLPIVTVPIAAMSAVARQVVDERDYSRRVDKMDDDEVGGLVDAFNAMLSEVESRTQQLHREADDRRIAQQEIQQLNAQLEQRVALRTQELERSNQALIASKAAADEANQAKSNFLATMSHEIRTPMNGVVSMVDVLHQSSLRADQVEMVDLIRDSGFALLAIIDDILDFSKIEAGRMEVEATSVNVAETVEGACAMLAHMALRKNVELCMFVDPRIPTLLLGDPLRLRQIVVNLANNAIKFSSGLDRPGRVRVRVNLASLTDGQASITVTVVDNGIGMDAQTKAKLFTAFSQSDSSTTRRYGGSGLGLAISHRLVTMMGGTLTAHGEPGDGATFSLTLPLDVPKGNVEFDSAASLPSIEGLPCILVGKSNLVPDLHAYLEAAGCQLARADNVDQALIVAQQATLPAVVIVDAHGLDYVRADFPVVTQLVQASRGMIAIRHHVRRQWAEPNVGYVEIDCNVLTRRRLICSVAAMAGLVDEGEATPAHKHRAGRSPPTREVALREGRLILVAEDNEFNQQVILRQLALLGHTADIAADGIEALSRWEAIPYALVLTDLHMPGMDGYELTDRIRQHASPRHTVPIIALTANALQGEADRCKAVGMDLYLTKPVLLEELSAELDRWIPPTSAGTADGEQPEPVLAPGVLEEFVGNDSAAIQSFLRGFEATAADAVTRIVCAWTMQDTATVGEQAHSLKSAARMAGAYPLASLCEQAEMLVRNSRDAELGPVVAALQDAVAEVRAEVMHLTAS